MSKAKTNPSNVAKRKGKAATAKPKTPSLIRYEELLKEMEALNLPPMDLVEEERRLRKAEGF